MTFAPPQLRKISTAFIARTCLCFTILLVGSQLAAAQSNNIYEIRGTPDFAIYHVNSATGTVTLLYNNYPGGSSATIAQRPSDGMLFYAINATNGQVSPLFIRVAPSAIR